MQTITSRKLYGKLNSFMGTMRDGTARKMAEGQQALIDQSYFIYCKFLISNSF